MGIFGLNGGTFGGSFPPRSLARTIGLGENWCMADAENKKDERRTEFWLGISTAAVTGIIVVGESALALNCSKAQSDLDRDVSSISDGMTCGTLAERGFPPHNHIEEFDGDKPMATVAIFASGSAVSDQSLGRFRWITFYRKMLWANGSKTKVAMLDAYADTAYEIARRYPDLEGWERLHRYNCFRTEINLTRARTRGCKDYSGALPIIARALRVPDEIAASLRAG